MLALLHRREAPLVAALLTSVFQPDRPVVSVADAHTEVADALSQLKAAGFDDLPDRTVRELFRSWVDAGWLIRQAHDDGLEVYRLSAHTVGALEITGRAGGGQSRVSRSRVRTLLDAVEQLAADADPDSASRQARLQREIDERRKELRRLDKHGITPVDDEQLLEEAENVLLLVRELPADFARVTESIKALQRETVTALRQDARPAGDVLRNYLDQAEHLMESTSEGRAFAGALGLIGQPDRLDDLAAQLDLVLRHPFATRLPEQQRAELRGIVRRIDAGLRDVNAAQHTASRVIAAQVRNHDPLRDRQVDELLREVIAGLGQWIPASRRAQPVDALRRLPRAHVESVRTTLAQLQPDTGPAPLTTMDDADDHAVSLADAQAWGGPNYAVLSGLLAGVEGRQALAALFADAPVEARRPVDLVGLLELAGRESATDLGEVAVVEAVRPDGSLRRLAFEGITVTGTNDGGSS
ncbi:MAG: DUF3375 domain-containing protein [Cellulomonadaceae bacterium]|jgi:hypothetical protein|nr:DUF3375 domain-containing protein [Cellulomonadaceae bacterium]